VEIKSACVNTIQSFSARQHALHGCEEACENTPSIHVGLCMHEAETEKCLGPVVTGVLFEFASFSSPLPLPL
jgi:hypothetical protein